MSTYDDKRQARIDRYRQYAASAIKQARQKHDQAERMGSIIPLVGHLGSLLPFLRYR